MKPGDRVKMTEKAIKLRLQGCGKGGHVPSSTGVLIKVVNGFLRVQRDNRARPERYHQSFWELDRDAEVAK